MTALDELELAAHMTEREAVQRAFDSRNTLMVALYGLAFSLFDVGSFIYGLASRRAQPYTWLVGLVEAAISITAVWVAFQLDRRKDDLAPLALHVSRNFSDWIVAYLLVQFAGFAYIGAVHGTVVWGTLLPYMLVALRFSGVRRFVLHAALFALTLAFTYIYPPAPKEHNITSFSVAHGLAIIFGSLNSRRVRRRTIKEWSERRESAREQLRMRDELRYARELQLSMLPEAAPQIDWADVAGISIPATEVGGDYFDYIVVDGRLAIVCGDVAGHGLASGITLSALRGGITLLRNELSDPAYVLTRLHEVVVESSRRRTLVTLTVALFDPAQSRATIANAGHPPVLVRRASGHIDSIELFGPPLGVRRSDSIPQCEVSFAAGDVFLLHSDGIYEATNAAGEQYGLDRLSQLIASTDGSASEIRDAVLRSVEQFRSSAPQHDDVTLVVVKITAAPARTSDQSSLDR